MNFGGINFENMLSGSSAFYRKRNIPVFSEEERERDGENRRTIERGIRVMRQMKTAVFETTDKESQQHILRQTHELSDRMAEQVVALLIAERRGCVDSSFKDKLDGLAKKYEQIEGSSAYGIPSSLSINNLFNAADDMLFRVEEKAGSAKNPDHRLSLEETEYMLGEFLHGINTLNRDARESFFRPGTKIGAILTGGAVNMAIAKNMIERYTDPSINLDYFVVAVDKEKQRCICEIDEGSAEAREVVIVDDTINKGGTILTAQWNVGEYFPKAVVHTGKGIDYAGAFEERRVKKHMDNLSMLFQDYADFERDGKDEEALVIFEKAVAYAKENDVTLQAGWQKVKARIDKRRADNSPETDRYEK